MQVKIQSLTERAGTLGRDIWSNAINMKSGWHGRLRSFFAFSFPLLLGALFFAIFTRAQSLHQQQAENEYTAKLLDQSRSIMARIQSEFSLSAQIEKYFRQIIEEFNAFETFSESASQHELAAVYQRVMPADIAEHAKVWLFRNSGDRFELVDTPPFLVYKRAAMIRTFSSLLSLSESAAGNAKDRGSERFITGVFGENAAPEHLAGSRAGKMTPVIFEGHSHYLFWQKLERHGTCIGGLTALFNADQIENSELALARLSENFYRESGGSTVVAFTLSDLIDPVAKPLLASDVVQTSEGSETIDTLRQAQVQGRKFPMRQLQKVGNYWLYRDQIDNSSPYTAWLIIKAADDYSRHNRFINTVAVFAVIVWSVFFAYKFNRRGFELSLAFRLLFFMTGMLPVIALLLPGLELIKQSETAQINERIQKSYDKLTTLDEKTQNLFSMADLVMRDILSRKELQKLIVSDREADNTAGFNQITELLRQHEYELGYILSFKPGHQTRIFAKNPKSMAQASHHADYYAFSCYSLHKQFAANLPDYQPILLSSTQKSISNAFGNENTVGTKDVFLDSLERAGVYEGDKSERQIHYSSILLQHGSIAAYLVTSINSAASFLETIKKELKFIEMSERGLFVCVSRDFAGGLKIYPTQNLRFFKSENGRAFRMFLESAAASNYRMQLHRDDEVYLYEPMPRARMFFSGAVVPVDDIRRQSDFKSLLLLVLIAFLSGAMYLLSASVISLIIRPIAKLSEVFGSIAQGNLDTSFTYRYNNELGVLARATESMISGLKERRLLGKFVSRTFDSEVISHTTSESAREMYGVILFSDIRNFTTLSESHPAEAVAELLNSHLREMVEIISVNGGEIEQFIGDAIVAFFPGEGAASCKSALEAARSMMLRHRSISADRKQQNLLTCEIGIGLEYGLVMAGILKSGSRSEFCVIGPARANAEHFEALSKTGRHTRIIVGNSLTRLLPEREKHMTEHDEHCSELMTLEQAT